MTIYIVPTSHWDIGFSGPPSEVAKQAVAHIDKILELARKEPRYRFTIEHVWMFDQWLDAKTKAKQQKMIDDLVARIRAGQIGLAANYDSPHSGLMSDEELYRFLYPAEELRRKYGLVLDFAVLDDNPGWTWRLASVFPECGVRFAVFGTNASLGGALKMPLADNPFYWVGPDGNHTLAWLSRDAYTEAWDKWHLDPSLAKFFHPELRKKSDMQVMEDGVRSLLETYAKAGYTRDAVMVEHAFDNLSPEPAYNLLKNIDAWNAAHESPKLVLATPDEFFAHMTANATATFPEYSGNWTGAWERAKDGAPVTQSILRKARGDLSLAEFYAAIPRPAGTAPATSEATFAQLYRELVTMDDHGAGPGGTWPKLMTQAQMLENNAEWWKRLQTFREEVDLLLARRPEAAEPPAWRAPSHPVAVLSTRDMLENEFYRIHLDPASGAIVSILDKAANRELVDTKSRWKFNGAVKANNLTDYLGGDPAPVQLPPPAIESNSTPSSVSLTFTAGFLTTTVRLISGDPKVYIANTIDTKKLPIVKLDPHSEHYFFTFPVRIPAGQLKTRLASNGGVVLAPPARTYLPGAITNALYPHYAVALDNGQDGYSIALALVNGFNAKVGSFRTWEYSPKESVVFVEALSKADFADTKDKGVVPVQAEPESTVQADFVLTSGRALTDLDLLRFGEDALHASLEKAAAEYFSVEPPNVELMTVKPASFGHSGDVILRLMELEGKETDVTLVTALPFAAWRVVAGVEADVPGAPSGSFTTPRKSSSGELSRTAMFMIRPHQILTLRLSP